MIDKDKIVKARSCGFIFVCSMCTRLHEGLDKIEMNCRSDKDCGSPLDGFYFDDYKGPLEGYLSGFCYVCGEKNPEYALVAKKKTSVLVNGSGNIGCCRKCFDNVVQKHAQKIRQERKISFIKVDSTGSE